MTDLGAPRGVRLGLPATGAGSLAPLGRRLAAFVVDILASALVAGLFTAPQPPRNWSLAVFVLQGAFFAATFGQTLGMRLAGIAVVRLDRSRVPLHWAGLRAVLVALLVPVLIFDQDQRGLHDRLCGTVMVSTR